MSERIKIPVSGEKAGQELGQMFLKERWCVHIGKIKNGNRVEWFIEIWKE